MNEDVLSAIEHAVQSNPLAHPLAFSIADMEFPLAPAGHHVDIYQSVFEGLNPQWYPNAHRHIAKIMPRDHGKSEVGSHVIPSWKALDDPNSRILIMMESEQQGKDKLNECRQTIERLAPKYGRRIASNSAFEIKLERDEVYDVPTIRAAGFETSVTGGHYDLIIFDDLISEDSVLTESRRDKTWQKFQERLNLRTGEGTVFLVLGTRKHPDDLYSKLIKSPGWDVTVEQAIKDWTIVENGEYSVICEDDDGNVVRYPAGERPHDATIRGVEPHREVDVLWPERYSLDQLIYNYLTGSLDDDDNDEGLSGSRVWIRENQNVADALMGEILSADMLTFVDGPPSGKDFADMPCYAGFDLALEDDPEKAAKNDTDFFAWAVAYYDPMTATFYVDDVRRKRGISMSEAIAWAEGHMARYPTTNIYVESNQAQRFVTQTLQEHGLYAVEVQNTGKKEERIKSMSARFENGKAVIVGSPKSPRWDSFISEWTNFPTMEHDDRLDAVQLALSARNQEDEEKKRTAQRPFV